MVSNLALFCLATVLATFQKNWAIFSKSSGHPERIYRIRLWRYGSGTMTLSIMTLSIVMLSIIHDEYHLCLVSFMVSSIIYAEHHLC